MFSIIALISISSLILTSNGQDNITFPNATTDIPTSNPTAPVPSGQPSSIPTEVPSAPSISPTSLPTVDPTRTPAPFPLLYGRGNYSLPPTNQPTVSETLNVNTTLTNCDLDNNCNQTIPSIAPTDSPNTTDGISPTIMSPSITGGGSNLNEDDYAWNDPIVLAVGLLGVLVLMLTCMVSIFACMAYTKSKENMRFVKCVY